MLAALQVEIALRGRPITPLTPWRPRRAARTEAAPRALMNITIPELCLVLLVGPSGSGKSTFARRHFRPTEVLSSDFLRGLVCDDEGNQAASKDAFEVLHLLATRRLAWGRLTV